MDSTPLPTIVSIITPDEPVPELSNEELEELEAQLCRDDLAH
jgi:hypothetical protein